MKRMRNMIEDAKKLLGIPPYELDNACKDDELFAIDCDRTWGAESFSEVCQALQQEYSLEQRTVSKYNI